MESRSSKKECNHIWRRPKCSGTSKIPREFIKKIPKSKRTEGFSGDSNTLFSNTNNCDNNNMSEDKRKRNYSSNSITTGETVVSKKLKSPQSKFNCVSSMQAKTSDSDSDDISRVRGRKFRRISVGRKITLPTKDLKPNRSASSNKTNKLQNTQGSASFKMNKKTKTKKNPSSTCTSTDKSSVDLNEKITENLNTTHISDCSSDKDNSHENAKLGDNMLQDLKFHTVKTRSGKRNSCNVSIVKDEDINKVASENKKTKPELRVKVSQEIKKDVESNQPTNSDKSPSKKLSKTHINSVELRQTKNHQLSSSSDEMQRSAFYKQNFNAYVKLTKLEETYGENEVNVTAESSVRKQTALKRTKPKRIRNISSSDIKITGVKKEPLTPDRPLSSQSIHLSELNDLNTDVPLTVKRSISNEHILNTSDSSSVNTEISEDNNKNDTKLRSPTSEILSTFESNENIEDINKVDSKLVSQTSVILSNINESLPKKKALRLWRNNEYAELPKRRLKFVYELDDSCYKISSYSDFYRGSQLTDGICSANQSPIVNTSELYDSLPCSINIKLSPIISAKNSPEYKLRCSKSPRTTDTYFANKPIPKQKIIFDLPTTVEKCEKNLGNKTPPKQISHVNVTYKKTNSPKIKRISDTNKFDATGDIICNINKANFENLTTMESSKRVTSLSTTHSCENNSKETSNAKPNPDKRVFQFCPPPKRPPTRQKQKNAFKKPNPIIRPNKSILYNKGATQYNSDEEDEMISLFAETIQDDYVPVREECKTSYSNTDNEDEFNYINTELKCNEWLQSINPNRSPEISKANEPVSWSHNEISQNTRISFDRPQKAENSPDFGLKSYQSTNILQNASAQTIKQSPDSINMAATCTSQNPSNFSNNKTNISQNATAQIIKQSPDSMNFVKNNNYKSTETTHASTREKREKFVSSTNESVGSSQNTEVNENFELFKYVCPEIKECGHCPKLQYCHYTHSLPPNWQTTLLEMPVESLLGTYNSIKSLKHVFLFKKSFSTITERLGQMKDFNTLISTIKDALKLNIESDRTPFIQDIVKAFLSTGLTFTSAVEFVFKNAGVDKPLADILSDILLGIVMEDGHLLENWSIIQMFIKQRNYDIDTGVARQILIESLNEGIMNKGLCRRIYNDFLCMIPDDKLAVFSSILIRYINALKQLGLTTEAEKLRSRCKEHSPTFSSCKSASLPRSPASDKASVESPKAFTAFPQAPDLTVPPPPIVNFRHVNSISENFRSEYSTMNAAAGNVNRLSYTSSKDQLLHPPFKDQSHPLTNSLPNVNGPRYSDQTPHLTSQPLYLVTNARGRLRYLSPKDQTSLIHPQPCPAMNAGPGNMNKHRYSSPNDQPPPDQDPYIGMNTVTGGNRPAYLGPKDQPLHLKTSPSQDKSYFRMSGVNTANRLTYQCLKDQPPHLKPPPVQDLSYSGMREINTVTGGNRLAYTGLKDQPPHLKPSPVQDQPYSGMNTVAAGNRLAYSGSQDQPDYLKPLPVQDQPYSGMNTVTGGNQLAYSGSKDQLYHLKPSPVQDQPYSGKNTVTGGNRVTYSGSKEQPLHLMRSPVQDQPYSGMNGMNTVTGGNNQMYSNSKDQPPSGQNQPYPEMNVTAGNNLYPSSGQQQTYSGMNVAARNVGKLRYQSPIDLYPPSDQETYLAIETENINKHQYPYPNNQHPHLQIPSGQKSHSAINARAANMNKHRYSSPNHQPITHPPTQFRRTVMNKQQSWYKTQLQRDNKHSYVKVDELKTAIRQQNISLIMSLIMRFKEKNSAGSFIQAFMEAIQEADLNFPTFFSNLCDNSIVMSKGTKTSEHGYFSYIFKTLGVNLVLYLARIQQWVHAHIILKRLIQTHGEDVTTVKLYINEDYSWFRKLLTFFQIYLKAKNYDCAWKLLKENLLSERHLRRHSYTEADIMQRNELFSQMMNLMIEDKLWHLLMNIIKYILYENITNIEVKKYIDTVISKNPRRIEEIVGLIEICPYWYMEVREMTVRAVVIDAVKNNKIQLYAQLYEQACNLKIYPMFNGDESTITLHTHLQYEETCLIFDRLLKNMSKYLPITQPLLIKLTPENRVQEDVDYPVNFVHETLTCEAMRVRIANILNNILKPPIMMMIKSDNLITIDPNQLMNHLRYRRDI